MKRFLLTFAVLMASLILVMLGFDAALDHMAQTPAQSSFIAYNEQGTVILAYTGDLNDAKVTPKPVSGVMPHFLHRT